MKQIIKLIGVFSKKERKTFFLLLLFVSISSIFQFLGIATIIPLIAIANDPSQILNNEIINNIYNYFSFKSHDQFFYFVFVLTSISVCMGTFLFFLNNYLIIKFSSYFGHRLECYLIGYYIDTDYENIIEKSRNRLISNIKDSISRINLQVIPSVLIIVSNVSLILFILVISIFVNFKITLLTICTLGIFYFIFFSLIKKKVSVSSKIMSRESMTLTKYLAEIIDNLKTIKFFKDVNFLKEKYQQISWKNTKALIKIYQLERSARVIMEFTLFAIIVMVFFLYYLNRDNIGGDIATESVIFFGIAATKALPAINLIYSGFLQIKSSKASFELVENEIRGVKEETKNLNNLEINFESEIKLENISYEFKSNAKKIFNNLNLLIKKNEFIAIQGTTGSGKSTLVDIVSCLLKPNTGSIYVDNIRLDNKNKSGFTNKISYLSQNAIMPEGTIRDILTFGYKSSEVNDDEIDRVIRLANCNTFIEELSNGILTKIGDENSKLSGGQYQRLGIARTLLNQNLEILILDESTNALDIETENKILLNLRDFQRKNNLTILFVTHKKNIENYCDSIIKVDDGNISHKKNNPLK